MPGAPSRVHPHGKRRPRTASRVGDAIETGLARFRRRGRSRPAQDENGDEGLPNLFEILTASMAVIEYELARHRLATDPVDVVIEPDVHGIRAFEFHKARQAIAAGEAAVEGSLDPLRRQLRRRLPALRRVRGG